MAESNQNISIVVDLIDKATAPLVKLREQIADLGATAESTSSTPITPQAEGAANVTTQLEAAAVAATTTSEAIASINAAPIQAVATASEAAAVALSRADAAEEGMRQEAAAMLGDLEAVAAQTNVIAVNTQSAAAAMGEGGGTAGGGGSKGGVTSGIRGAANEIRNFSRLMLVASAAIKGIEIGWDAVDAGIAAAHGDTEKFDTLIQKLDKDVKSIPFVGSVASDLGARINSALNLPEISFANGELTFKSYNESIVDYAKHTEDAAKNQDKLSAGIKNLNDSKRENLQIESQVEAIQQEAASVTAANNDNDFRASLIRLDNLQRERAMRLELSKLGTEEGIKANDQLSAAERQQFGKQQALKLAQDQDAAEQQLNETVTNQRNLLDQGAISQDQYTARINDAVAAYQKLSQTIADNAQTLAGKSYTENGIHGASGFGLSQEELDRMNDRLRAAAQRAQEELNPYGVAIRQNLQSPLQDFVASTILNFRSVKQAFGTLLSDLASQLANFVASKVVNSFLNAFTNGTSGYGGLIGKIGGIVGAAFGGGGASVDVGPIPGLATGGVVPGSGSGDTVHAMLTPGERVMNLSASRAYGPLLDAMNAGDYHAAAAVALFGAARSSGRVQSFATGGVVQSVGAADQGPRPPALAVVEANAQNVAALLEGGGAAVFDFFAKNSRQLNAALGR